MATILAIDDDRLNLNLIKVFLSECEFKIVTAADGVEGWQIVEKEYNSIDLILLDRNMPNMDGMQFMHMLKQSEYAAHIPVIMQTAATSPEEISEGVKTGVYYYLAKPFERPVLISLVNAALQDAKQQKFMQEQLQQQKILLDCINRCDLSFRTIQDALQLAPVLATFFPQPKKVLLGISELLINAVEHGNAGIGYSEKTTLTSKGTWRAEVDKRINNEQNRHKTVRVHFEKTPTEACLTIEDDGPGFNWLEYLQISPERASNNHGRGIAMSKLMSFDQIEYQGNGNKVVCRINLPR